MYRDDVCLGRPHLFHRIEVSCRQGIVECKIGGSNSFDLRFLLSLQTGSPEDEKEDQLR